MWGTARSSPVLGDLNNIVAALALAGPHRVLYPTVQSHYLPSTLELSDRTKHHSLVFNRSNTITLKDNKKLNKKSNPKSKF